MSRRVVTKTLYEWDRESYDLESDDVIDHDWSDTFPGLPTEPGIRLVLIKDVATGLAGLDDSFELKHRAWAYVQDGKLPAEFDDGSTVPKRFHIEIARP